MKNTLLKSLSCLFILTVSLVACTEDSTSREFNETQKELQTAARGDYWQGIIGYDMGHGVYQLDVDPQLLMNDLEDILTKEGNATTLTAIEIVEKTASNDPADTGYMLIANDGAGKSIGVMLEKKNMAFRLSENLENPKTISCSGCTDGCFLQYFNIDGKKVPYCNSAGCGYDCRKTETSFN